MYHVGLNFRRTCSFADYGYSRFTFTDAGLLQCYRHIIVHYTPVLSESCSNRHWLAELSSCSVHVQWKVVILVHTIQAAKSAWSAWTPAAHYSLIGTLSYSELKYATVDTLLVPSSDSWSLSPWQPFCKLLHHQFQSLCGTKLSQMAANPQKPQRCSRANI